MDIPLTSQAAAIVNRHLSMGYTSAAEVIEEALRRLDTQTQLEGNWLRSEVQKGLDSGEAVPYDLEAIAAEADAEFGAGIFNLGSSAIPQH
jgi:antitoxin ParD1/3/4